MRVVAMPVVHRGQRAGGALGLLGLAFCITQEPGWGLDLTFRAARPHRANAGLP